MKLSPKSALFAIFVTLMAAGQNDHKTWRDYGSGPDNSKFIDLTQITKANVNQLKVAWEYPTQDANSYLFNPIVIGKVIHVGASPGEWLQSSTP